MNEKTNTAGLIRSSANPNILNFGLAIVLGATSFASFALKILETRSIWENGYRNYGPFLKFLAEANSNFPEINELALYATAFIAAVRFGGKELQNIRLQKQIVCPK